MNNKSKLHAPLGETEKQRHCLEESLRIYTELYELSKDNIDYAQMRAAAEGNLGSVIIATGDFDTGIAMVENASNLLARLYAKNPEKTTLAIFYGNMQNNIAHYQSEKNDLANADASYGKAIATFQTLSKRTQATIEQKGFCSLQKLATP